MATSTPNIGLTLPIGTENVSRQIINTNNTKIDEFVNSIQESIGIVIDGDTADVNVTSGQYVILRNSTIAGKTDGIYTAANNVSSGTAFVSADLTAVPKGRLNAINDHLAQFKTIKTHNFSTSSNAYGNFIIAMPVNDYILLDWNPTSPGNTQLILIGGNASGSAWFRAKSATDWSDLKNTTISGTLRYLEL